jgi:preprotein translocase subunit SecA
MPKWVDKVFGTHSDRVMKRLAPTVRRINAMEAKFQALSDDDLRAQTGVLREQLANGAKLDKLLVPAFATMREAGRRVLGMRHYDVQLAGGVVLHEGKIAEMRTGEGKTLVATLAVYLNALEGKGVHLVTVNDYLAARDAEWMGKLYNWLGLDVGVVTGDTEDKARFDAYRCDVTYGTNNEFGFDYLRDNMKFDLEEMVQRPLNYAIIDEVDSVLVDEARTPLIISGPAELSEAIYHRVDRVIPKLKRDVDFALEVRSRSVTLTEQGVHRVEELLGVNNMYDMDHIELVHHVNQSLRAHAVYRRDVDYMVQNNEVVIVDEFTGRLMDGRRWSDGLHQAVEAKEGVSIKRENHTLATITFQNYFRMYGKCSGMTGTAETEREEFMSVYGMDVVIVPTNKPILRDDVTDQVYKTETEKFDAICEDIESRHGSGQPILAGTASVERSEVLSRFLKRRGVPHTVLNAKYHERESEIVAQAGRLGAVTIATNMAGRGTDILLGGNPEFLARERVIARRAVDETVRSDSFKWLTGRADLIDAEAEAERQVSAVRSPSVNAEALEFIKDLIAEYSEELDRCTAELADEKEQVIACGGLHILGSERHESRRIDNQLRGRAGRQGDPGSSCFFLSLEDDLMRRFGGEKLVRLMEMAGMKDGEVIDSPMVMRQIERAQKQVEAYNFGIRKNLLEMDNVMNQQRMTLYKLRRDILGDDDSWKRTLDGIETAAVTLIQRHCPAGKPAIEWRIDMLEQELFAVFDLPISLASAKRSQVEDYASYLQDLGSLVFGKARRAMEERKAEFGDDLFKRLAQTFYLRSIDHHWKDHLTQMDHLKEGIYLRGYGQKDPKHEYRREGFTMFLAMLDRIARDSLGQLFHVQMADEQRVVQEEAARRNKARQVLTDQRLAGLGESRQRREERRSQRFTGVVTGGADGGTVRREQAKVGRNEPCPCGSGKKYKQCHGRPGVRTEAS